MEKRDWLFEVPSRRESEPIVHSDHILQLKLSELAKRDLAIKIYSEILDCELWLCSNDKLAAQVKQYDPEAVIYTADELRGLYKLQPSAVDLRAIHDTKDIFKGSRSIDSSLKRSE